MSTDTTTTARPKPKTGPPAPGGNGHRSGGGPFEPRGPDGPEKRTDEPNPDKYRIGIWIVLVGVLMLFLALSSAYYIRMTRGLATDEAYTWKPLYLPPVLWANSAVLLFSSVAIEVARRKLRRQAYRAFNSWVSLTGILGFLFLAGQLLAWRSLAGQGVYLSTNPHSSFFYVLTCLHGLHLIGGLIGVLYITVRGHRYLFDDRLNGAVYATSVYWHFMDGLWIYLFVLLFFLG